jgi:hypothetical protein
MFISVINHTAISDADVQRVLRALNRQIEGDFAPYWSMSAQLRLEGKTGTKPSGQDTSDMRGDAVVYLWDSKKFDDALGYHDRNFKGIPFGFVFTELSKELGEHWSTTLSHEALELIADPEVNLLVQGPHPKKRTGIAFHWYEMCDAVQADTYEIDGVVVSNFVLPLYFTHGNELGGRNDFLGVKHRGKTLDSFGVNPGGYIGYFDADLGEHDTFARRRDTVAEERMAIKGKARGGRRSTRYKTFAGNRIARGKRRK